MSEERTEEFSEPRLNIKLATGNASAPDKENGSKDHEVSTAKVRMQNRLPALGDDAEVGVEKEHSVTRDGKADLLFTGVLLASAAPTADIPQRRLHVFR